MQSITIHGRTRAQQYGGQADWEMIDHCARLVQIPVVGNGDIATPQDVQRAKEQTAVAGVMIGRAAMNAPWLFSRAKSYLLHGSIPPEPTTGEKLDFMLRHTRMAIESAHYGDELVTMRAMRARLLAYAKGIPGSKPLRPQLARVSSLQELQDILTPLR